MQPAWIDLERRLINLNYIQQKDICHTITDNNWLKHETPGDAQQLFVEYGDDDDEDNY